MAATTDLANIAPDASDSHKETSGAEVSPLSQEGASYLSSPPGDKLGSQFLKQAGLNSDAVFAAQMDGTGSAYKETNYIVGLLSDKGGKPASAADKEAARQELEAIFTKPPGDENQMERMHKLLEVCKLIQECSPSYIKDLHIVYTMHGESENPPAAGDLDKVTHVKIYIGGDKNNRANVIFDEKASSTSAA